jgi:GDP-4-dehydro-6-deoxy-D-mannose reductase
LALSTSGRTCLLIGSRGLLGTCLRQAAVDAGLHVVATTRLGDGEAPACDLLDRASVERCVEAVAPDLILNAAGSPSVARSWEHPDEADAINAGGVRNLLEASARSAPRAHLVCLSSAAVYGQPGEGEMPLGEDAPLAPVSPYGEAKLAMEVFCREAESSGGQRIAVVRAFNLIGPGQPPFNAASSLARQIAEAELVHQPVVELTLGNPGAARDLIDVRDAARALVELASKGVAGIFNLCSGQARTVAELAAALAPMTALEVETRTDPALARPSDPPLLLGDPSRLREATGFAPEIPLERSLADLLGWWRRQLASA